MILSSVFMAEKYISSNVEHVICEIVLCDLKHENGGKKNRKVNIYTEYSN